MIKSQELSNPNSCLNRAAPDEPIFVLKSTDELAPHIVRVWASDYFQSKHRNGGVTEKQMAKYDEAIALAKRMEEWRKLHD